MKHSLWLAVALSAVTAVGCSKSADTERREAEKAAAQADQKAMEAESEAAKKVRAADQKATEETMDFLTAVTREKGEMTGKIQDQLEKIEKRLGELKVDVKETAMKDGKYVYDHQSKDVAEIERLLARRANLRADFDAIKTTIPHDWPALKAKIDRDLSPEPQNTLFRNPTGS